MLQYNLRVLLLGPPIGPIVAPKKQTTIWNVEELECGQGSGAKQRVLGKERDGT